MSLREVTNKFGCKRGPDRADVNDGEPRYLRIIDEDYLDPIDESSTAGPFTAHLATGTDFQFGILRQLPIPLVDHSFYLRTLYGAVDIPWPANISLSFPTVSENKTSCILPAHELYSGDGSHGNSLSFHHNHPRGGTTEMKYFGLASLMFVLYGIPVHVRCLLVEDIEAFNFPSSLKMCPVLFDGRIFETGNMPFNVNYIDSTLSLNLNLKSPNLKYPFISKDFELSVYLLSNPVFPDFQPPDAASKTRAGLSFNLEPSFNKSLFFDESVMKDQTQKVLMLGRLALMELRRFNELCGVIFDHSKIAVKSNHQHFRILNGVLKRKRRLRIKNMRAWDNVYDRLLHFSDSSSVRFVSIDLGNLVDYREWASLLDQMGESIETEAGPPSPSDPPKPVLRRIYSSGDEAAARTTYEAFLADERFSSNSERKSYEVREARLPCQHFLAPGFTLA
ncbi:hypothetical protein TWF506_009349 [Arthrobotrys conoides]|uniref:Uncharacterized protein n=1 Tax=Arthrobotrys conoides TaxID=74498 RepID=A0AAN8N8I2_9PEZI